MIISIIPPANIVNHFDKVVELAKRAERMLHPYGKASDVLADCMTGRLLLWGVFDETKIANKEESLIGILITEKVDYWRCSVMELILLAGDRMDEWLDDLNNITDQYAKDLGCIIRRIPGGRKGWVRKLEKLGFKPFKFVHLECAVGKE